MTDNHPITPPPELVQAFLRSNPFTPAEMTYEQFIATRFARWGADMELEACCQALYSRYDIPSCIPPKVAEEMRDWLRDTRRPKPPSLKETLLARVARIPGEGSDAAYLRHWVDNESQRLVDLLHEVFKSLPD